MYRDFEETLIAHCAATLAGHKAGSLFSYRTAPDESLVSYMDGLQTTLHSRGVEICLLKHCAEGCLVYVYRPALLAKALHDPATASFLADCGYESPDTKQALLSLARRIHCGQEFPHEIGVFLGYPLHDVLGFIEHRGQDYRCLGCWKAYADEAGARRRFALYHKCRDVYLACYRRGFDVARLTVTA